eukprot:1259549-Pleurochrysis_carterae.AAC.1
MQRECREGSAPAGGRNHASSELSRGSFQVSFGSSKLIGKLQFVLSWCSGRFGRAAMQPLYAIKDAKSHFRLRR